jgi:hypothetical protein
LYFRSSEDRCLTVDRKLSVSLCVFRAPLPYFGCKIYLKIKTLDLTILLQNGTLTKQVWIHFVGLRGTGVLDMFKENQINDNAWK